MLEGILIGIGITVFLVILIKISNARLRAQNDDPFQQTLAGGLVTASLCDDPNERADIIEGIEDMIFEANFSSSQLTSSMAHACSLIKLEGNNAVYERSKRIANEVVMKWPERYSVILRNDQ